MKKTRMSIDDIHAMVGSIRKNVLNMRVTNIYDIAAVGGDRANKTYVLKLHQPPFPKIYLLLESGVRFHTSKYARDASSSTSALPSQFTMKLRKHLRGKRLVGLTQLEGDRVVDFTFGSDQLQCHLILELYAAGNIILTDENYTILSLLRTHKFDENVKMAVRQEYPVSVLDNKAATAGISTPAELIKVMEQFFEGQAARAAEGKGKKAKVQTLKQLLLLKETSFGGLGPVIIEHCIVSAGLSPTLKIKNLGEFRAIGDAELVRLIEELQQGWQLLERLQSEQTLTLMEENEDGTPVKTEESSEPKQKRGFIVLKGKVKPTDIEQFEEFTPFLYAQHREKEIKSYDTFDEAVDEYFSHFESQTAEVARQNAMAAAESKLEKLRKNQKQQIDQLIEVQEKSFKHAQLIESNQQDVENVLLVVRSALASGMDWRALEELVRFEQKNGNPVACLIHQLDLANNRVAILLCDGDDDEDEDEDGDEATEDKEAHVVWIDLSLSALANAREIYSRKKKAGEKVKKATEATERAIQIAEKNTTKTLQKQQIKRHVIYQRRKTLWFEKFHWFISSENYLVIGGKDAHQNELLVKRYLRKGDVYVHADLHGAATCIIRNRMVASGATDAEKYPPIPVLTLEQAGCMSVCRSNAWTNQVIAAAYWVHADQVSKTAPAGEYLTTGSFMIRGKKNYITPSRLEMGLAMVFRVDESSLASDGAPKGTFESVVRDEEDYDEKVNEKEEELDVTPEDETPRDEEQDEETVEEPIQEEAKEEDEPPVVVEPEVAVEPQVETVEEETRPDDADAAGDAGRDGKKRLTAKQRRDLKKGRSIVEEVDNSNSKQQNKSNAASSGKKGAPQAPPAPQPKQNVRGKKGKLKKMKKKYADQDEDERRIRMEALGHVVPDEEQENEEDGEDNDEGEENEEVVEETKKPNKTHSEEYIRQQREKKEKFLEQEEEEAEGADFFDAFTGSPSPQDLVLFAMPMCAPYTALLKYKYKVKLLPGSVKKGKAAKSAMEYFFAMNLKEEKDAAKLKKSVEEDDEKDEATPDVDPVLVQRELMKTITENELIGCMVGPVKISAPGLHGASAGGGNKKSGGSGGKKGKGGGKKK
ncbi:hypothetical protein Poli38472_011369 [Pythium oligandrum]|uniref:Ribosome quality control complex subunit 2 n=1 Tax=Pythium oligandrum TaxID=41045 RepID=A0A8K1CK12_PYTOL|nr:hypothetical protein Poli38472_011369 [Pythium oligandrum]|eukprot:TMW64489.1 hypothetical protein Poli38472_011369 [Pythium oligandrum]